MKLPLIVSFVWMVSTWSFAQLPYSWVAGVNPGWVSTPGTGSTLQWQAGCNYVTSNCTGNYLNNSLSVYTSPVMDASCSDGSTVNVTFTAFGSIEYGYDFLFIEYSLNGGATWINPYGAGVGWTGNFGAAPGMTIPAITTPTSSTMRYRLTFQSDYAVRDAGLKITDFDIVCNVVLPIELVDFKGTRVGNENVISWSTLSERKCDYFEVEYATDPEYGAWNLLATVNAYGDSEVQQDYQTVHKGTELNKKYYYRLIAVDTDAKRTQHEEWVVIDTKIGEKTIARKVGILGNEVDNHYHGMVFIVYDDGTVLKTFQ